MERNDPPIIDVILKGKRYPQILPTLISYVLNSTTDIKDREQGFKKAQAILNTLTLRHLELSIADYSLVWMQTGDIVSLRERLFKSVSQYEENVLYERKKKAIEHLLEEQNSLKKRLSENSSFNMDLRHSDFDRLSNLDSEITKLRKEKQRLKNKVNFTAFRAWAPTPTDNLNGVIFPLKMDRAERHTSLSSREMNSFLSDFFPKTDNEPWYKELCSLLSEVINGSNGNITKVFPQQSLNVNLLPYSDCLVLGCIFYGIKDALKDEGLNVQLKMPDIYQNKIAPSEAFRVGYDPEGETSMNLEKKSFTVNTILRESGLPAKIIVNSFSEEIESVDYLSPFLIDLSKDEIFKIEGENTKYDVNLRGVSIDNNIMAYLLERCHWLKLIIASQSSSSIKGVLTFPDLFVWAREAGLLCWGLKNALNLRASLKPLTPIVSKNTDCPKTFYANFGIYFNSPFAEKNEVSKDTQKKAERLICLIKDIIKTMNLEMEKTLNDLDENKLDSSAEAIQFRDALLTSLFEAKKDYKGILTRLSPRGLLSNACRMEKYDQYKPAAALALNDFLSRPKNKPNRRPARSSA